MLPRLCAAEFSCTQLKQQCTRNPVRCLSSRVVHCTSVSAQKSNVKSYGTNKFKIQSTNTIEIYSKNSTRVASHNDLGTNSHHDKFKMLPVQNRSNKKLHNYLKNNFNNCYADSESANTLIQKTISFPLTSKIHFTHQDMLACSPLSTNLDVRFLKDERKFQKLNSNKYLSSNGFSSINPSISTNGIHSSALLSATDYPKLANLNPDFEVRPTLPQRFVEGCPPSMRPYLQLLRIDRPIGTWLLFWPCGWGLALAAGPGCLPDPWLLTVFGTGALVMRGAGCTINDLWDKDIDVKVSRTKTRPLASGAVTPFDAWIFLGGQLSLGLLVLLQLNGPAVMLGASSLVLVCVYPLVKRVSHWPQFVLGLTFNWGVLLGWCAVHGSLAPLPVLPLYAAGVCWTLVYDTIYSHQDKVDDLAAGVKSTALRFGEDTAVWLTGFSVAMVTGLLVAGQSAGLAWPYYGAVAVTAANLVHQIRSLDIHNRAHCGQQFRHNRHIGLLMFLGIIGGSVLAQPQEDTARCSCSSDVMCAKCRSGAGEGSDAASGGVAGPLGVGILKA